MQPIQRLHLAEASYNWHDARELGIIVADSNRTWRDDDDDLRRMRRSVITKARMHTAIAMAVEREHAN